MQERAKSKVYNVLKNNTARLENEVWLDNGLGAAVWSNSHGSAAYEKPGHHTLSFYLSGGQNTKRCLSSGDMFGGENKLCLMPQDHRSSWSFADPFCFFHLYFEQKHLQDFTEQVFDKEGRHTELKECTFVDDPFVISLIRQAMMPLDWNSNTDKLMLSHAQQILLLHLVRRYCHQPMSFPTIKGGLSPQNQRKVADYIEAMLSENISLTELAGLVQLSEFHFARMFKTSFGCTPHQYVLARRIGRAKALLSENVLGIADIASLTGFSSQQHLSTQFKHRVGVTPSTYRREQGKK